MQAGLSGERRALAGLAKLGSYALSYARKGLAGSTVVILPILHHGEYRVDRNNLDLQPWKHDGSLYLSRRPRVLLNSWKSTFLQQ